MGTISDVIIVEIVASLEMVKSMKAGYWGQRILMVVHIAVMCEKIMTHIMSAKADQAFL